MSDGSEEDIENIVEGDLILGVNTSLMSIEVDTVTLIPELVKTYRRIYIELENNQTLEFFPAHPFWVDGKGWSVFM